MHGLPVILVLPLALSACAQDAPEPRPTATREGPSPSEEMARVPLQDLKLELSPVVEGLGAPVGLTNAGDGSGRLFIVLQEGLILTLDDDGVLDRPFLDIVERVTSGGEQGLLGLAFHPRYESNGRLFVDYTDLSGDTVVAEYEVSGNNPNVADADSERVLLHIDQPYPNHNGGHVTFGPDGYLYIGMGDGGSGGDPHGNGQNPDTLLGKLLRIDVDGRSADRPYAIPTDNPFASGTEGRPEIWATGLRNPWRFSFDEPAGTLWIADVGQSDQEEVDRVDASEPGLNYGWNAMEGTDCYLPPTGCDKSRFVEPLTTYSHEEGCSITGGYVYRGAQQPLVGVYLFSDYCSGDIYAVAAEREGPLDLVELLDTDRAISSFGLDEDGELYAVDLGGAVLKLVAERR